MYEFFRSYRDDFYQQLLALDRLEVGGAREANFPDTATPLSHSNQRVCSTTELASLPTRTLNADDVVASLDSLAMGERAAQAAAAAAAASAGNHSAISAPASAATTAAAATAAISATTNEACEEHAATLTSQAGDFQARSEPSLPLVEYSQEGCAVCLEPWQLHDLVILTRGVFHCVLGLSH